MYRIWYWVGNTLFGSDCVNEDHAWKLMVAYHNANYRPWLEFRKEVKNVSC